MKDLVWDYRDPREFLRRLNEHDWPPLIISVAGTGGGRGKETSPMIPETPKEQVDSTYEAYRAGASIVHVHARDPQKGYAITSLNPEDFRQLNGLIRDRCPDIIINDSSGGSYGQSTEQRVRILDAMPEIASLNSGPNPYRTVYKRREPPLEGRPSDLQIDGFDLSTPSPWNETESFAKIMLERKIKPEIELFNPGQFWIIENLITKKLIAEPYLIDLVMGVQGGIWPTPKNLITQMELAPQPAVLNVVGQDEAQLMMCALGVTLGLHVRTGLEDTIYFRKGELAKSNTELVERVVRLAKEMNREVATPAEARRMLGISETPRRY